MDMLENLEIAEATDNLQDSCIPAFMRLDETKEFAPNMEVQAAEIRDVFFDMPELRYDEWKELSCEERIAALNQLEQRTADIAMRTPLEVKSESLESNVMGLCDGKSLTISDQLLMSDSEESYAEVFNTLFHEGRHAYQYYNLDVERVEQNKELVDSWKVNFEILGYDDGDRMIFKDLGFYEYYSQPVEVDARVFAETVCNTLGI